ncbi:GAF domain-containing protein [Streptomyces cavernae]|uniref:GAF domain-containing protein n=1 Tax=Streptomyces cavernae TaxID=2259034 RepID=UPI000FEB7FF5|nr:GAF domain-containing protein [Streptomyces cavernae]
MAQRETHPPRPGGEPRASADPPVADVAGAPGGVPAGGRRSPVLRPVVAQSWQRCEAARISRDGKHLPRVQRQADELAGYREGHPLASILPTCRDLLGDVVRELGWVFALGDERGALLWVEGDPRTRSRIERIHFVEGALWSEDAAGTNAPGTALAVGAPVRIRTEEHFNEAVRPWSCAASPIRDPDSGQVIGVLDITGGDAAAGPQALALVRATTRAVEADLARQVALRDLRAHETYGGTRHAPEGAAALVSPGGRVLVAGSELGLTRIAGVTATGDGRGRLPDGRRLLIEPVGVSGYVIVRFVDGSDEPDPLSPLRLSVLGRDTAMVEVDGRTIRLGPRHSEIMVLLARAREGITARSLAEDLSCKELNPTTLRVDMSRLRALVGEELLASRPYLLRRRVRTDAQVVEGLLDEGRLQEALALYAGPLLPRSHAPGIVRLRAALHERLRSALLAGYDVHLLQRWLDTPWGADDTQAWQTLSGLFPVGSPRRAEALERAESRATPREPGSQPQTGPEAATPSS